MQRGPSVRSAANSRNCVKHFLPVQGLRGRSEVCLPRNTHASASRLVEDKSRMVDLAKEESFSFLGFEYRRIQSRNRVWRPTLLAEEADRAVRKILCDMWRWKLSGRCVTRYSLNSPSVSYSHFVLHCFNSIPLRPLARMKCLRTFFSTHREAAARIADPKIIHPVPQDRIEFLVTS
jgi:hypothetical protein